MYRLGDNITLSLSKDKLTGFINIFAKNEEEVIDFEVKNTFQEINNYFKYGLKKDLLLDLLEAKKPIENIAIAEGKTPIPGKDGSIKFNFDLEKPLLPKINPDGTVDYKELDSVNVVNKDMVLAQLILPIEGEDGIGVDGSVISHIKGKTPKLQYGKNTIISEDGLSIISQTDGLVEYQNGKIIVSELLIIENIDNNTGNVDFPGNVIINKDMLNGFTLKATGNIEVKGAVEGGFINSDGDVLVRQGIQGYNKLTIDIKGNLSTKFIENSIIKVGQNITSEAIMHSEVSSKSNILVLGRKGLIVGGLCRAKFEIRARTIGSSMATTTILEVGIDPDIKTRYNELESNLDQAESNLEKIEQSLKVLEMLKKTNRIDEKKLELYNNLLRAKISLSSEITRCKRELLHVEDEMSNLSMGKIKVADIIYPGVKIVIGNSYMYIRDEMRRCTFYEDGGDIRVGPY